MSITGTFLPQTSLVCLDWQSVFRCKKGFDISCGGQLSMASHVLDRHNYCRSYLWQKSPHSAHLHLTIYFKPFWQTSNFQTCIPSYEINLLLSLFWLITVCFCILQFVYNNSCKCVNIHLSWLIYKKLLIHMAYTLHTALNR